MKQWIAIHFKTELNINCIEKGAPSENRDFGPPKPDPTTPLPPPPPRFWCDSLLVKSICVQ